MLAPQNLASFPGIRSDLRRSSTDIAQVVEADHPPYHYDGERIIFLQDVFIENDTYLAEGLEATPIRYSGDQTMVLVNGKGAGTSDDGNFTCNDTLSVINVECGKTYRLRFVGGTAISFNSFAIEGHDSLEVIEADGYVSSFATMPDPPNQPPRHVS